MTNLNSRRARRLAIVLGAVLGLLVLTACQEIGGASNTFGNDPTRAGAQPGVWATINGPYTNHQDGDPYSTKCAVAPASATSCDASGANPTYNTVGYLWGVDVPAADLGVPVTVAIYDPAMAGTTAMTELVQGQAFATSYQMFKTTGTGDSIDLSAANSMSATGGCSAGPGSRVFAAGTTESRQAWFTLCTFTPTVAGLYPIQVKSSAIPGVADAGGGYNSFSIRSTAASATQPRVAALGNASISIVGTTGATTYLANVGATHAGQTLTIDLYDPGDGASGTGTVQILAPPSGIPATVPTGGTSVACSSSDPSPTIAPPTPHSLASCTVTTRDDNIGNRYNNAWLRITVRIPATYTCSTDCWWTMANAFGSGPAFDRLVYQVTIG